MTTIRVPQRFRWLRLIAAVGVVLASYQVTFSQTAPIDQEYIRWLEERSVLFQADQQDEAISGKGVAGAFAGGCLGPATVANRSATSAKFMNFTFLP